MDMGTLCYWLKSLPINIFILNVCPTDNKICDIVIYQVTILLYTYWSKTKQGAHLKSSDLWLYIVHVELMYLYLKCKGKMNLKQKKKYKKLHVIVLFTWYIYNELGASTQKINGSYWKKCDWFIINIHVQWMKLLTFI